MANLFCASALLASGLLSLPSVAAAQTALFSEQEYTDCNAKMDAADQGLLTADRSQAAQMKAAVIASRNSCAALHERWLADPLFKGDDRAIVEQVYAGVVGELAYFAAEGGECIKARGWFGKRSNLPDSALSDDQTAAIARMVNSCVDLSQTIVAPPPEPTWPRRSWGYSLLAAGAASVVGGVIYNAAGAATRSDYDDAYAACTANPATCDRNAVATLKADIDGAKLPLALLYGLGVAAAGTGGTLLVLDWMGSSPASQASLQISPLGAAVAVRW